MIISRAATPSLISSLKRLELNSFIISMTHFLAGSLVSIERASKFSKELREPTNSKILDIKISLKKISYLFSILLYHILFLVNQNVEVDKLGIR